MPCIRWEIMCRSVSDTNRIRSLWEDLGFRHRAFGPTNFKWVWRIKFFSPAAIPKIYKILLSNFHCSIGLLSSQLHSMLKCFSPFFCIKDIGWMYCDRNSWIFNRLKDAWALYFSLGVVWLWSANNTEEFEVHVNMINICRIE